jgi:hypothetical protein
VQSVLVAVDIEIAQVLEAPAGQAERRAVAERAARLREQADFALWGPEVEDALATVRAAVDPILLRWKAPEVLATIEAAIAPIQARWKKLDEAAAQPAQAGPNPVWEAFKGLGVIAGALALKVAVMPVPRPEVAPLSGGRSGSNVKNLTGLPPNSAIKGFEERVYVTNDKGEVILDITKDRVKPVTPGVGFGPKRPPTPEELNLIRLLHGGP